MHNSSCNTFVSLSADHSIRDCVEIFESTSFTTVFITDSDTLLGTVTDGDIRRGLLVGYDLNSKVSLVMNRGFSSLPQNYTFDMVTNLLSKLGQVQLPILRDDGTIHSVYSPNSTPKLDIPVVIMAGGRGKRLRPLTDSCPKPMIPVNGTPMLEIIIKNFIALGVNNFFLSVNYMKEQIIDHFGDGSAWDVSIEYIEENQPLGTAGSLSLLPEITSKSIIITNGDVLSKIDYNALLAFFSRHNSDALMCIRSSGTTIPFGVVSHREYNFISIEEKPTYDFMVNAGVYILSSRLLRLLEDRYLDMPDFFEKLSNHDFNIHVFPIHEEWYDVGRPATLKEASRFNWQQGT
jgi:dTDP-glucose pyrophosphorylase